MKNLKRLTAWVLAFACIFTLLPTGILAVEYTPIATEGEMTLTEDFSNTSAMLEYGAPTYLTGSVGFQYVASGETKESPVHVQTTLGTNDGAVSTAASSYYGLVSDKAYMVSNATGLNSKSGYFPLWAADTSDGNAVKYSNGTTGSWTGGVTSKVSNTPYRFTGLDGVSVTSLKKVSVTLYDSAFTGNEPDVALIYNYMDNGNYDFVYITYASNSWYFRFGAVRTEIITVGESQYKKIYLFTARNGSGQANLGTNLTLPTRDIATTSGTVSGLAAMTVTAEYLDGSVKFTFSDGTNSLDITKTDAELHGQTATDIYAGHSNYYGESQLALANATMKTAPSKATGFGILSRAGQVFVDNISVTYEGPYSESKLVADFKDKYAVLLAKDESAINVSDSDEINNALADYQLVVAAQQGAAAQLSNEKNKLDTFASSLAGASADAYFTEYGALFAQGFVIDSAEDAVLVREAVAAFQLESDAAQTAINSKAQTDHSVTQSSVLDHYKALTNAYYFKDGVLVYDDFNSYADQAAYNTYWENVKPADGTKDGEVSILTPNADKTQHIISETSGFITVPKSQYRGDGMLEQFKVTMKFDSTTVASANSTYPVTAYYDPATGDYWAVNLQKYTSGDKELIRLNNNVVASGMHAQAGWRSGDLELNSGVNTLTMTFDYEYATSETATAPTNYSGGSFNSVGTVTSWIKLKVTIYIAETNASTEQVTCIFPAKDTPDQATKQLSKSFTAGFGYMGDTKMNVTYESVSYTYAKSDEEAAADAFKNAHAQILGKELGDITVDDKLAIQKAQAAYNATVEAIPAAANLLTAEKQKLIDFAAKVATLEVDSLVSGFRANHGGILEKSEVQLTDKDAVEAALNDYHTNIASNAAAAAELAAEKSKLDGFMATLSNLEVVAYFETYGSLFETGFKVENANQTVLIRQAVAQYNLESSERQEKINSYAANTYGMTQTDVTAYYKTLTDDYYFKGDVLIHDDFNSYVDQEAYNKYWQDVNITDNSATEGTVSTLNQNPDGTQYILSNTASTITVPKAPYRGAGTLKQMKVTFTVNPADYSGQPWLKNVGIYYDPVTKDYCSIGILCDPTEKFVSVRNNQVAISGLSYGGWGGGDVALQDGENTVTLTIDYEYRTSTEATKPTRYDGTEHNNVGTVTSWVALRITLEVAETSSSNTHDTCIFPKKDSTDQATKQMNENFLAGFGQFGGANANKFQSISYTYARGADEYSAEFEAYADTYNMSVSAVTKDNLTNINAALVIYNGFEAEKLKDAYEAEADALNKLLSVATFHQTVSATVTPATDVAALNTQWTVMAIENTAISGDLAAMALAYEAFRPEMWSATIKASEDMDSQRLRFNVNMPQLEASDAWTVKEYGVVMLPNQMLNGGELTLDTEGVVRSYSDAETLPQQFRGYLELVNGGALALDYGVRIAARGYIIYTVEEADYIFYTENTKADYNSEAPTKSVKDGVAVRSAASIAKAMAADLYEYYDGGTWSNGTETLSIAIITTADVADKDALNALLEQVNTPANNTPEAKGMLLKFVVDNLVNVENISKIKNAGGAYEKVV